MTSRSRNRIAAAALGLALALGGTTVANAMPASQPGAHVSARPMAQEYFWDWSDGYNKLGRTFKKSDYGSAGLLPHLIVSAEPASPRHAVVLKYYEDGKWYTESTKNTNSAGKASLNFNPWCNAAHTKWCDGSWKYKVTIAGLDKTFTVKFSSK